MNDTDLSKSTKRAEECTVLVVDDEVDIATYLASVLEDAGLRVVVAHDGEQAAKVLKTEKVDLISLDLVMPKKSGIRLLMDLRKDRNLARIPVVIVTAHARDAGVRQDLDEVLAESTMTGPSMYLEKPVTPLRYLRGICDILGIEPEGAMAATGDSHTALRDEARNLLEELDAATLEAVVGEMRKTQR